VFRRAAPLSLLFLAAACTRELPPPADPTPLPQLRVEQIAPAESAAVPRATGTVRRGGPPVSLTTADADIRRLIPLLAEAAGVSVVLAPEVAGRVSLHLEGVRALAALHAVLDAAGLMVRTGPPAPPWGPAVFVLPPVNIERADAATIHARFDVSPLLARWIVANRR